MKKVKPSLPIIFTSSRISIAPEITVETTLFARKANYLYLHPTIDKILVNH